MEDETFDTIYGSCKAENLRMMEHLSLRFWRDIGNSDHARCTFRAGATTYVFSFFSFSYKERERERVEIFI